MVTACLITSPFSAKTAGRKIHFQPVKFTPPTKTPTNGITISATKEETIFPKAAPITTATTKSTTFPLTAKSLNSFNQ